MQMPIEDVSTNETRGPIEPWAQVLETVLACRKCGASVTVAPVPKCTSCDWTGVISGGIVDYVDEGSLGPSHHAELEAQRNAVEEYYENESRLCCHWDRMSADDLPARLGWPTGVVLDLGCGTGTAGGAVRRAGATVVGADLSLPCLEVAKRRMDAVVRTDASRLPFVDECFDGLVSRGALHHLAEPEAALIEMRRVLKPGAPVLFLDPREFAWLEPIKDALRTSDDSFTHDHHAYDPSEYRALIETAFDVEDSYSEHPFGVLMAAGLDLLPIPAMVPTRAVARGLLRLDSALNKTPLRRVGHLLVVSGRKR